MVVVELQILAEKIGVALLIASVRPQIPGDHALQSPATIARGTTGPVRAAHRFQPSLVHSDCALLRYRGDGRHPDEGKNLRLHASKWNRTCPLSTLPAVMSDWRSTVPPRFRSSLSRSPAKSGLRYRGLLFRPDWSYRNFRTRCRRSSTGRRVLVRKRVRSKTQVRKIQWFA